jgi:hypothetical protein
LPHHELEADYFGSGAEIVLMIMHFAELFLNAGDKKSTNQNLKAANRRLDFAADLHILASSYDTPINKAVFAGLKTKKHAIWYLVLHLNAWILSGLEQAQIAVINQTCHASGTQAGRDRKKVLC